MLKNAPTLAIVAVHTEENEPLKIWGDLFNLIQFGPYPRHITRNPDTKNAAKCFLNCKNRHRFSRERANNGKFCFENCDYSLVESCNTI